MSEASFASLNPTLLARKGGAKPAMRPQLAPLPENLVEKAGDDALEDLGWNDMGGEDGDTAENSDTASNVVALTPEPSAPNDNVEADPIESPLKSKPRKVTKAASKARRAAFTLRLDTDRHLKLRLAATMRGVSAQAFVTEALDQMLDQIEDLDALAERMKRN